MLTAQDFIVSRQAEMNRRRVALVEEELLIQRRLQEIKDERERLDVEDQILLSFDDRGLIIETETRTRVSVKRMSNGSRMFFEDALKAIFDERGHCMTPAEIRTELERFSYKWDSYSAFYQYITKHECIENVSRGFYQFRRGVSV